MFNNLQNYATQFMSLFASRAMPLPPSQRDSRLAVLRRP
jgi:hypothetical protein